MRMMQFTPKIASTFVRSRLGLAVASSLMLATMGTANAVDVGPGQTVTITPGSAFEGQNLSVHGGTANVLGARMGALDSFSAGGTYQTIINADGAGFTSTTGNFVRSSTAVFRNSVLSATTGPALGLARSGAVDGNGRPYPKATLINSSLTSTRVGLQVFAGGYADVDSSTISGGTYGVSVGAGSVSLRNGSTVNGVTAGILINSNPTIEENLADWGVTVDGSHIEASNGSAILFGAHLPSVSRPDTLLIQNGATLVGSNGVLISTRDNAHFDVTARTSTLKGDITIADTATGTLRFLDGLDLTGRILGPADVTVDQGGRWTLSGDSNTGNLTLGAGSDIFLGATGTAAYPQLTVNGNYAGNGGTLHFNTVLAGDDAASSRVHVTGNTSGTTQVTVNNIAGAGAQTVNGIPLVQVDGASNGHLALQGRAIGGMYEYFLRKGTPGATNGNWYLTSAYTGNPCDINPALPECKPVDPTDPTDPVDPVDPEVPVDPVPVLRPEPGAYLANQAAAVQMFQLRRHDRGEPSFDRARIGTWVRAGRDQLQANVAGQVDARTHINTLQLGSDVWRWGDGRGQVGVMLGTGEATTQAVSTLSGYGTRGKVKGKSAGVYLGWVQDAQSSAGLYVDGWLQAARFDNEVQGEGIARETYDSRTRSASLEAGYAWAIRSSEASTLYLQPQAQLTWTDYDGDSLVENNGTTVEDGRGGGLNSRLGVRLFGQGTLQGNRVQPFLAANWLRGQRDASMRFNSESLNAKTPENRYEVQAGAQLQLGQRWSAWGDLRVQRGDSGYRNHGAQVGLRAAW